MRISLPYGHQIIGETDISAVIETLKSDILTGGNTVAAFEDALCSYTGAKYGIAVSSGTAALHAAINAIGLMPGDEVIVPPLTFAASANCVCYQGGKPVFVDVEEETLLLDPRKVESAITAKTRAIIGVDYAGQTCEWDSLRTIADRHNLALIADSCHALGAEYKNRKTGTLADLTVFSFHPVKHITTGEGGMVVTNNRHYARKMKSFRNHGINSTPREREEAEAWEYDMTDLGYNYRITDFQCSLGLTQLKNLSVWLEKRKHLAAIYDCAFKGMDVMPLKTHSENRHAWHLYVVKVAERNARFKHMRNAGIGVNVHYKPVYLHSWYQDKGYEKGLCPVAEKAYTEILTLPLWPGLREEEVKFIADTLCRYQRQVV